jgi:phenylalanyl-tRNA synthetase beta subunit
MTSNNKIFKMWSLFPFIARDVAVWVPDGVENTEVLQVIKSEPSELIVKGPELFDEFKKEGKTSYAFKIIFQSYERTLTDTEVNEVMTKIADKIKAKGWEVR